jgi:formylmethanofuran dehydrogenase subunit E
MEAGQFGLGIQLVVLLVVEVHNCILEVVQILHQMRLGRFVLETRTMWQHAFIAIYISRRKGIPVT